MRMVDSIDPDRQTLFRHKDKLYSVVDLTMFPLEENGKRYEPMSLSQATEWSEGVVSTNPLDFYRPYHYEIARITGKGVKVLGRYKSAEEAIQSIVPTYKEKT